MLELLAGIDAVRRLTEHSLALEPAPHRRPTHARRSRAARSRAFVSAAIVALGSPSLEPRPRSIARHPVSDARAD